MRHDFVIAVRSYKRSDSIKKKTLGELLKQTDLDLKKQLFVAVTKEELELYKVELADFPMNSFIVVEPGGYKATNGILDYFPEGKKIIFMDDDITNIKEYRDILDPKSSSSCLNLGAYFDYAFSKFGDVPFGFDFTPNLMFKQSKPFAEMKMRKMGGAWWGAVNDRELLRTEQSHEDDNIRASKALMKHGVVGSLNWLVASTAIGTNSGGMQASGDRSDSATERKQKTLDECYRALENESMRKFYQSEPVFVESMNFYVLRMKNIRILKQENKSYKPVSWSSYFQEEPDAVEDEASQSSLEDFFK